MKPQRRILKMVRCNEAVATVVLGCLPFGMMAAFVVTSAACVKVLSSATIALASVPYVILGGGAGLVVLLKRSRRGVVWIAAAAALLAVYHVIAIIKSSGPIAPANIQYLSPAQTIGMGFAFSGFLFGFLALVCVVTVLTSVGSRRGRSLRAGLCESCGYDLAGLSEGAVCPECGVGKVE